MLVSAYACVIIKRYLSCYHITIVWHYSRVCFVWKLLTSKTDRFYLRNSASELPKCQKDLPLHYGFNNDIPYLTHQYICHTICLINISELKCFWIHLSINLFNPTVHGLKSCVYFVGLAHTITRMLYEDSLPPLWYSICCYFTWFFFFFIFQGAYLSFVMLYEDDNTLFSADFLLSL